MNSIFIKIHEETVKGVKMKLERKVKGSEEISNKNML